MKVYSENTILRDQHLFLKSAWHNLGIEYKNCFYQFGFFYALCSCSQFQSNRRKCLLSLGLVNLGGRE